MDKKKWVLAKMIENGQNPIEAEQKVNAQYDTAIRIYGEDTSIKKLAEIITIFSY